MRRMFRGDPRYALGWLMGKLDCAMVPREGRRLRLRRANRDRLGVAVGDRILGFTIEGEQLQHNFGPLPGAH